MPKEINDKLLQIVQFCTIRKIEVDFSQHGTKRNRIEETIRHGENVLEISIGNPDDENLPDLLDYWIKHLDTKE